MKKFKDSRFGLQIVQKI